MEDIDFEGVVQAERLKSHELAAQLGISEESINEYGSSFFLLLMGVAIFPPDLRRGYLEGDVIGEVGGPSWRFAQFCASAPNVPKLSMKALSLAIGALDDIQTVDDPSSKINLLMRIAALRGMAGALGNPEAENYVRGKIAEAMSSKERARTQSARDAIAQKSTSGKTMTMRAIKSLSAMQKRGESILSRDVAEKVAQQLGCSTRLVRNARTTLLNPGIKKLSR